MNILDNIKNDITSWIEFSLVLIISIIVLWILSKYFNKRIQHKQNQSKTLWQLFFFLLVNVIIVLLIINTPLSESIKTQLLSLIGITYTAAIALSSTTFLGNLMGGLMIKVLKKMRPGDFVKVDNNFGRVTELGLLHTEIQTQDRDLTILPNLYLVANAVKIIRFSGTVVSEEVSLGYDIHHNQVEIALLEAASKTGLEDPYMHVQCLGDFSITYKIHGFLKDIKSLLTVKSKLRENMLDSLHKHQIEIVSPTFMNQRLNQNPKKIIPHFIEDQAQGITAEAEKIVFDKADEAESIENLKGRLSSLIEQKEKLADDKAIGEKEKEEQLKSLENNIRIIKKLIEIKKEKEE